MLAPVKPLSRAPGQMACIKTTDRRSWNAPTSWPACPATTWSMVEGYRKSGLPTIEIMRAGNAADARTAEVFAEGARKGWALGTDFTQFGRDTMPARCRGSIPPIAPCSSLEAQRRRGGRVRASAIPVTPTSPIRCPRPPRSPWSPISRPASRSGRHLRYTRRSTSTTWQVWPTTSASARFARPHVSHGHPSRRREPPHGPQQGHGPVLRPTAHLPSWSSGSRRWPTSSSSPPTSRKEPGVSACEQYPATCASSCVVRRRQRARRAAGPCTRPCAAPRNPYRGRGGVRHGARVAVARGRRSA